MFYKIDEYNNTWYIDDCKDCIFSISIIILPNYDFQKSGYLKLLRIFLCFDKFLLTLKCFQILSWNFQKLFNEKPRMITILWVRIYSNSLKRFNNITFSKKSFFLKTFDHLSKENNVKKIKYCY
jgi:hypothetical protein